jgi:hypothetical protein
LAADAINQVEEKMQAGADNIEVTLMGNGPAGEIANKAKPEPERPLQSVDRTAAVLRILSECGVIRFPGPDANGSSSPQQN